MQITPCATRTNRTPRDWKPDERVTLSQAARIAPGKVSPNCIWRWCRRGVLSRMGERIHLQHIRVGGKLYTSPRWIEEFGERLADADAAYFKAYDEAAEPTRRAPAPTTPTRPRRRTQRPVTDQQEAERRARVRAELDAEGL